jgi:hypothetical protein
MSAISAGSTFRATSELGKLGGKRSFAATANSLFGN